MGPQFDFHHQRDQGPSGVLKVQPRSTTCKVNTLLLFYFYDPSSLFVCFGVGVIPSSDGIWDQPTSVLCFESFRTYSGNHVVLGIESREKDVLYLFEPSL